MTRASRSLLSGTAMTGLLLMSLNSVATAADLGGAVRPAPIAVLPSLLPAVSGVNGKIEFGAGYSSGSALLGSDALGFVGGALSFPVANSLGVQLDAFGANENGRSGGGAAAHVFWRNPSTALFGVYGEGYYTNAPVGDFSKYRVGPEFELYLGQLSLTGIAGAEFGNRIDTGFFSEIAASYYATDNFRLYVGHRYGFMGNQGKVGLEYQLPAGTFSNVTVFGEARIGEDNYSTAFAGVKVHFGAGDKPLIRRHREDDPEIRGLNTMSDVNQAISGGKLSAPQTNPGST